MDMTREPDSCATNPAMTAAVLPAPVRQSFRPLVLPPTWAGRSGNVTGKAGWTRADLRFDLLCFAIGIRHRPMRRLSDGGHAGKDGFQPQMNAKNANGPVTVQTPNAAFDCRAQVA